MVVSVEVLITGEESKLGTAIVNDAAHGAERIGLDVRVTDRYRGGRDWLCLYGAGAKTQDDARRRQVAADGRAALWDMGYMGAGKDPNASYMRVSIDHYHPQAFIGRTAPDPSRWNAHGIALRDDYDASGPVIVAGMGPKSRDQFQLFDWEMTTLQALQARFPERAILYRPKRDAVRLKWEPQDGIRPIADVLRGASLVVCRHSSVAVDACIAGIPVECTDGAAHFLYARGSNPSVAERLDFLYRLSWFNYRLSEMETAWKFLLAVSGSTSAMAASASRAGPALTR